MFPILQQRIDDKARQVDHPTTSLTFRIGLDKLSAARIRMRNIRKRALNTKFGFFKINITPAQRQELATAQAEKRYREEASHTNRASTCYQFLHFPCSAIKQRERNRLQHTSDKVSTRRGYSRRGKGLDAVPRMFLTGRFE